MNAIVLDDKIPKQKANQLLAFFLQMYWYPCNSVGFEC